MYSLLDSSFIKNSIFALWTFCLRQPHLVGNWISNKVMGLINYMFHKSYELSCCQWEHQHHWS